MKGSRESINPVRTALVRLRVPNFEFCRIQYEFIAFISQRNCVIANEYVIRFKIVSPVCLGVLQYSLDPYEILVVECLGMEIGESDVHNSSVDDFFPRKV